MQQMDARPESKYLNPLLVRRGPVSVEWLAVLFLVVYFIVPQYFGIPFPLFDFTILRMVLMLAVGILLFDLSRREDFFRLMRRVPFWLPLLLYLFVTLYTMLLRIDFKAFLNPAIELISFYILIYFVHSVLGVKKTLKILVAFSYILGVLGILEYLMGRSPFSYLETIPGLYTGIFIRSGSYRIMGPALHSLGYGLMLITCFAVAALDTERNEINLLKRPLLNLLLAVNVFLTGSRSTLGVFLLEIVLLFLFSPSASKKKFAVGGGILVGLLAVFLVALPETPVAQNVMLQMTSVADEVLGTEYAVQYGADVSSLEGSSNYREQLVHIFGLEWLNPLLGIGRSRNLAVEINGTYIYSVDSFYIAEFVRYAWPGFITYVVFILCYLFSMLRAALQKGAGIYKALFIGAVCYFINLLWLDSLQTLKYVYLLFAIFVALRLKDTEGAGAKKEIWQSKYLLKPTLIGKHGL